jgi:D-inositol-3-phosphate glycosyltransferase
MSRRIALVSDHASPLSRLGGVDCGGQNLYVGQVAKSLSALGHEVDIFTRRDSEVLPETADWIAGVRIIHVPAGPAEFVRKEDLLPFMEEFTAYMVRFCRCQRKPYDVIHANFWMSGLVASDLKRILHIPFVITFHALGRVRREHQGSNDLFPDERFIIEDRIVREADHIIAEAPQDEEDLLRLYKADPSKITMVPCGFDSNELWPISKALARITLGLPPDAHIVLHVGRLVPRKGIDNVIRGFAAFLRKNDIGARLLIVGGESDDPDPKWTPEIGTLRQIANEEDVLNSVTMVGRRGRDHLKYYYSAADVFVTTPWYEPFGITPLEAMACGTPVIGSNVGGIKFTVCDGETGFLVPPHDANALADALSYVYARPERLSILGRQAIRRVNELFTWNRVAIDLASVYERVLMMHRFQHNTYPAQREAAIQKQFERAIEALCETQKRLQTTLLSVGQLLSTCFHDGGKVFTLSVGNTGLSSEYWASAFNDWVQSDGPPLAVFPLDHPCNAHRSCEQLVRHIEAFGQRGDVLLVTCVGPLSEEFVRFLDTAKYQGLKSILLIDLNAGHFPYKADAILQVPAHHRDSVMELHLFVIHMISTLIKKGVKGQPLSAVVSSNVRTILQHHRSRKFSLDERTQTALEGSSVSDL